MPSSKSLAQADIALPLTSKNSANVRKLTISWYTWDLHPERYALERLARRVAKTAGRPGILVDDDLASSAGDSRPEDDHWEGESDCSGEEWNPADWGR